MQVKFTSSGLLSITAETKKENEALFNFVNSTNVAQKQQATKKVVVIKRPTKPEVKCPVIGCSQSTKSLVMHMRMAHGIQKDGTITEKVMYAEGLKYVPNLAVKLQNGQYRLVKAELLS